MVVRLVVRVLVPFPPAILAAPVRTAKSASPIRLAAALM
jgi:hypothetical protein